MAPSTLDRLNSLLSSAGTRTYVVGPKPPWARPLAMAVLTIALSMGMDGQALAAGPAVADQQAVSVYNNIGGGHGSSTAISDNDQGPQSAAVYDNIGGGHADTPTAIQASDENDHAKDQAGHDDEALEQQEHTDVYPLPARSVQAYVDHERLSPVIRVGLNEQGVLDRDRLFSAWSAAGLIDIDGAYLLGMAWTSGTVVVGAQGLSGEDDQLEVFFEEMGGDLTKMAPAAPVEWDLSKADWDDYLALEDFESPAGNATIKDGQRALTRAAQTAGLASLRMPLSALADPDRMVAYAAALENTNTTLAQVSGWKGQVLGLAGRVNLTLGMNAEMIRRGAAGVAGLDVGGDGIVVIARAGALSHEWAHAVKFAVENPASPKFIKASEAGVEHASTPVTVLVENLTLVAPEWKQAAAKHPQGAYLASLDELMARSLEKQVELRLQAAGVAIEKTLGDDLYGASYPDNQQAMRQSGQWNAWFSTVGVMDLTSPVASPRTLVAMVNKQDDAGNVSDRQGLDGGKLDAWRAEKAPKPKDAAPGL